MNLSGRFFRTAEEHPERVALWVDGEAYSCERLTSLGRDEGILHALSMQGAMVFVDRQDVDVYVNMLCAHAAGIPHVPVRRGAVDKMSWWATGDTPHLAYILFTSGSTGEPKGVPISHKNALAYVEGTIKRLNVTPEDRFSQMHDLTFDFSVHDVWVPWNAGASVYVVPKEQRFAPARFIREHELTVFSCVPSVVTSMDRLGLLTENAFPSLRWVTLCGEALTIEQAEAMQRAAPNATIENMYGPTECTVGVTSYIWDPETSPAECRNGIVPIGRPFPGHQASVVDGELCIYGPQVFGGYWRDEEATARAFHGPWYRTGDLVEEDENGCLHFIGRRDNQVQVRGHRVEMGEVEHVIREATGAEVVCIGWPESYGSAKGVVAAVAGIGRDVDVRAICRERLADYKVPYRVLYLDALPHNRNQKVDRKAVAEILETREAA